MSVPGEVAKANEEADRRLKGGGQEADPDNREQDPAYWKARFESVRGMLEKAPDPKKYHELAEKVNDLSSKLEAAEGKLEQAVAEQASGKIGESLKAMEDRDFDSDLLEVLRQNQQLVADQAKTISKLNSKIDKLEGNVRDSTESARMSAEQSFWSRLKEAVPDHSKINREAEFIKYMNEVDPGARRYTGEEKTRQQLLEEAAARLDADAAIAYYTTYLERSGRTRTRTEVETQVSPEETGAGAGGEPSKGGKKIWTVSGYQKVTQDAIQGRITEEEYERATRDYMAAAGEGRLRRS